MGFNRNRQKPPASRSSPASGRCSDVAGLWLCHCCFPAARQGPPVGGKEASAEADSGNQTASLAFEGPQR